MRPDIPLVLISLLLGLVGVTGLVEHSLYGGFNRVYYAHGLPFVIVRLPVPARLLVIPPPALLQAGFKSALIGSLIFQQVAPDTYGFRRRFFESALIPDTLVHGMLHFDRERGQVVLKGFINVFVVLLALVAGVFSLLGPLQGFTRLLPLAVVGLVIGIPVLVERQRCLKLARYAADAWSASSANAAAQ